MSYNLPGGGNYGSNLKKRQDANKNDDSPGCNYYLFVLGCILSIIGIIAGGGGICIFAAFIFGVAAYYVKEHPNA